ncbi:MAG: glutamyl-tRNA reductase [Deltaproteobacteria bacterium]|nr:glutamyl-tRNA reductase [Deltaproteobacteria bacterium]
MGNGPLRVMGLSHHTAPVAIRERFAFDDEAAVRLLRTASKRFDVREAVLLSTCNRTEIYYVDPAGRNPEDVRTGLLKEMAAARGRQPADLEEYLYVKADLDMVRHLFRVASSLDSLVLGEPQILGQVKSSYRLASEAGTLGGHIGKVFERAFKVAKEIRNSTAVGEGEVSMGSVAVDLAGKVFGDLSQCTVLMIGAGKMAEAVARTLASAGVQRVVVANRSEERALKVAEKFGWNGTTLDDLPSLLDTSDMVIASVSFPGYVVDRRLMKAVMARRRFRPVFVVDISLPRVVEPEVGRLEGAYLYNIDDFNQIIGEHLCRRAQDADAAEDLINREIASVQRKLRELSIQPLIGRLRDRSMELKDREMARALGAMGDVDEEQRKILDAMATSIVNKMLHNPINALRQSTQDERDHVADAARELFGLVEEEKKE